MTSRRPDDPRSRRRRPASTSTNHQGGIPAQRPAPVTAPATARKAPDASGRHHEPDPVDAQSSPPPPHASSRAAVLGSQAAPHGRRLPATAGSVHRCSAGSVPADSCHHAELEYGSRTLRRQASSPPPARASAPPAPPPPDTASQHQHPAQCSAQKPLKHSRWWWGLQLSCHPPFTLR